MVNQFLQSLVKILIEMLQVYENSGVKHRFIVNELGWYGKEHSWMERNNLFKKNAKKLLINCIQKTLRNTKKNQMKSEGLLLSIQLEFQHQLWTLI